MPTLIELQTFTAEAVRIVNDRPLIALSDHPNDLSSLTPSSFLGQQLAPNTPVGTYHDKGDLRRDFLYNANLGHRFFTWMTGYLLLFRVAISGGLQKNLTPGQLVLLGDSEDIFHKGAYRLGRIHRLHPQLRKSREIDLRKLQLARRIRVCTPGSF